MGSCEWSGRHAKVDANGRTQGFAAAVAATAAVAAAAATATAAATAAAASAAPAPAPAPAAQIVNTFDFSSFDPEDRAQAFEGKGLLRKGSHVQPLQNGMRNKCTKEKKSSTETSMDFIRVSQC